MFMARSRSVAILVALHEPGHDQAEGAEAMTRINSGRIFRTHCHGKRREIKPERPWKMP
jgi:hypothetical protein